VLPARLGSCRVLAFFFESMVKPVPRMLYDPSIRQQFVELMLLLFERSSSIILFSIRIGCISRVRHRVRELHRVEPTERSCSHLSGHALITLFRDSGFP